MKNFLQIRSDGFIESFGEAFGEEIVLPEGCIEVDFSPTSDFILEFAYNFDERKLIHIGKKPSSNHVYSNYSWVLDRDLLLEKIRIHLNQYRLKSFSEHVEFDGALFDADVAAIANIQSTLLIFQASQQLPENFVWRTFNNQTIPMTFEKLQGLAQVIYNRNSQIYAESWALKDSLPSKTDEELIALYESLMATQPG